jgi:secretion/DNA translocation related TadE-like protein
MRPRRRSLIAGTALVVGVLGVVGIAGAASMLAGAALAESHRISLSADLAALAGADVALGWAPGEPCAVAERVAAANRAPLSQCTLEGLDLIATATGSALGVHIQRSSRAGPPRT